jgi:hypothetical protein
MVTRATVALVAVLAMGWLGVLLRDERVGASAADRIFYAPELPPAELVRQLDRMEGARLLDPDPKVDLNRAGLLLLRGRRQEAAAIAGAQARREPANLEAWRIVFQATRDTDPDRAKQALAAIRHLNPLGSRPAAAGS